MKNLTTVSLLSLCFLQPAIQPDVMADVSTQGYGMEVLVSGYGLTEYAARGTHYIEALPGREYTIRLSNPTGRRVAVALSVDGMNSIDAKRTTAQEASKWVIAPYQTLEVKGWQTSNQTARAFFFTSEAASYGAWMGETQNLGVISAAFFPEVMPEKPIYLEEDDAWSWGWGGALGRESAEQRSMPSGAESAPAPARSAEAKSQKKMRADDAMAATGIGREKGNRVTTVEMELEAHPVAMVSLRYEYRPELVRLGVFPAKGNPLKVREEATGFEGLSFAPDPYWAR